MNWLKWLLSAFGLVILGAVGSGFWEVALSPTLGWIGNALLYISTLGLSAARDSIYVEVARGSYERASLQLLGMATGFAVGITVLLINVALFPSFFSRKLDESVRNRPFMFNSFVLILVFLSGFLTISFARSIYVARAANYLEQYQRVVAPYVNDQERLQLASQVAQIRTRADYLALVSQMDAAAQRNSLAVPYFNIY